MVASSSSSTIVPGGTTASSSLIKTILHKSLAEGVYRDVVTRSSNYYYFLGKTLAWDDETAPPYPIDSYAYERAVRSEIITMKQIGPSDICFVIPRYDWVSGVVYDMYDDEYCNQIIGIDIISGGSSYNTLPTITITGGGGTGAVYTPVVLDGQIIGVDLVSRGIGYTSVPTVTVTGGSGGSGANLQAILNLSYSGENNIEDTIFYVMTDDYNVYKCLDNNNNSSSTVKPSGTSVTPITTSDGYIWKYMYNVPINLRNKFLSAEQIPVSSALTNQFYSNGSLDSIAITNKGTGYTGASISVTGDGYREEDPVFLNTVTPVTITTAGTNYFTAPTVTFGDPVNSATLFIANSGVIIGQKLYNSVGDFFEIYSPGTLSALEPTHRFGIVKNGTASLKYIGTRAKGTATLGTSTISLASGTVSTALTTNLITVSSTVGFYAGQRIVFGTTIGTIVSGTTYYILTVPNSTTLTITASIGGTAKTMSSSTGTSTVTVTSGFISGVAPIGAVREINLTSAGTGYTTPPAVNFSGGGGSGATAVVKMNTVSGSVLYATVTNIGDNYSSDPTVTFGTAWSSEGQVQLSDQIFASNRLYTVTTAGTQLNITKATYTGKSVSVSARDTAPSGLAFSTDGLKMFVLGDTGNNVVVYNLSIAWDVSTAVFSYESGALATETTPVGLAFSTDGLKMFVVGQSADLVQEYTLATAFTISTSALTTSATFSIVAQDTTTGGMAFSSTGTKLWLVGATADSIFEYTLGTAFSIATATYTTSFSVASQTTTSSDICVTNDGKNLLVTDSVTDDVYQYTLATANSIATALYTNSFYVGGIEGAPTGIAIHPTNAFMYLVGSGNDTVYQYQNLLVSKLGTSAPSHTSGTATNGDVILTYAGIAASGSAIRRFGAGYSTNPSITFTSVDQGSGVVGVVNVDKSNAKLLPIIDGGQVVGVTVENAGTGYTAATLAISGTGTNATMQADLNLGDIKSLQANNEILTTSGTINAIKLISGGYGYGVATITISGDGTGATATASINTATGRITKINITNPGQNYTWADIVIAGNGKAGTARAIISPYGGHGKNAPDELFARTLMFYSNVSNDLNQGVTVNNDYRQLGIIKNPRSFLDNTRYQNVIGSGCFLLQGSINITYFPKDTNCTVSRTVSGTTYYRKYRVVSSTSNSVLIQSLDNDVPQLNDTFTNAATQTFTATNVTAPTVDKYSGQLMFIDNKAGFTPSDDETVTLRTVIRF
jgi:sugar lactone lactonase YvrE